MQQRLAVFGDPIDHSLSPLMHNHAFVALGMPYHYEAVRVPVAELAQRMDEVRSRHWLGVNLTLPLKVAALPHVDDIEPLALTLGAVNTVTRRNGLLVGANTDAAGFVASLRKSGIEPEGQEALILGAGGGARAVACGLVYAGVRSVFVVNRTEDRAERLAASLKEAIPHAQVEAKRAEAVPLERIGLVINATSVGLNSQLSPWHQFAALPKQAVAVDLVYKPLRTAFLLEAEAAGLRTIDGLGMLAHQAAESWRHWFGEPGPSDLMERAAREHLSLTA